MSGSATLDELSGSAGSGETAQLGMWVFLASEVLFFGGLLVAYAYGRTHWPDGFAVAGRHTHVVLGTVNTAILLTSSAVVALGVAADELALRRWVSWLLATSAALGLAFLAVKGIEYGKEWHEGLFPGAVFALKQTQGAELFFMLYFVMTGLHALHLIVGVVLLSVFASGVGRGRSWAAPRRVEVVGLYWHFVDIVWIVLYPLIYLVNRHA